MSVASNGRLPKWTLEISSYCELVAPWEKASNPMINKIKDRIFLNISIEQYKLHKFNELLIMLLIFVGIKNEKKPQLIYCGFVEVSSGFEPL